MVLQEMSRSVNWIHMAQNKDQWQVCVNIALNLQVQ
jgi:hypothetical protein